MGRRNPLSWRHAGLLAGAPSVHRARTMSPCLGALITSLSLTAFTHAQLGPGPPDVQCGTPCPAPDGHHSANPWPGGIVYYDYVEGYPGVTISPSPAQRAKMEAALGMIAGASGVQFTARTNEPNYVTIRNNPTTSCNTSFSTAIGMTGAQQFLDICVNHWDLPGLLMHEMMHALGLYHEHQRSDRDAYISIHPAVAGGGGYTIINGSTHGPYDFASLMHYQSGRTNGDRRITVKAPYDRAWHWDIGRYLLSNATLSNGDIWVLNHLYPGGPLPPRAFDLSAPDWGEAVGPGWTPSFEWEASEGATLYRLIVDDSPLFNSPEIDLQTAQTQYVHPAPLADHRLYFWRVIASNPVGTMGPFPRPRYVLYTGVYPSTLHVDDSAPLGGDGTSWASPLDDLAIAAETAYAGEGVVAEIRVAQGTYAPDLGSGDRSLSFWLADGCALRGGYAGYGASDPDARDVELYETVLSGDLNGDDLPGFVNTSDNTWNIVFSVLDSSATEIDGVTIRGGRAGQAIPGGAGVNIQASDTTVRDTTFEANDAPFGGAALIVFGQASPTFERCRFIGNRSAVFGSGGALYAQATGLPLIDASVFMDNQADGGGGALSAWNGLARVTNSLFTGNSAGDLDPFFPGGGAMGVYASATIWSINNTIVGNTAAQPGGGLIVIGNASVSNTILWSNTPDQIAGAPFVSYSNVEGGSPGTGNISAMPVFLGGGSTPYALGPGSPGIDAGSNTSVPAGILTDLAGEVRFLDDPGAPNTGFPGGAGGQAIVDIGAYERRCYPDCNTDGVLNLADLGCFQTKFALQDPFADCNGDGNLNLADFGCFQTKFALGCP